ncbi:39S ribosomal protein L45 [Paucibacter sp. DJ1R-11]|uniref:Tim44 domain-containing protein n=1 Tax=Paucibacter sp. DJ1R-11 TaxID=2893556 RepID=UPI0021E3CE61|nr:Tim44-like domain-containing protein [Paucibacter sp. DJ1R-11]MCV2365257.1 39S ribosomal protein L45 [Paucibacter sp. DJ1R-11]
MKRALLSALIALTAVSALSLTSFDAEAKRLGGGGSAGMKRTTPSQSDAGKASPPAQQAAPAPQQAAPAVPAAAGAAAAAPKRNWMGPIAGLAAGLGLAALASHFGMGGALANVMTMLLIGGAVLLLVTFLMRRFGGAKTQAPGMQYAGAGAGAGNGSGNNMPMPFQTAQPSPVQQPASVAAPLAAVPSAPAAQAATGNSEDAAFEQLAKRVFIRLQAANDAGDQTDLRRFTTPEMYGVVQQELLDRKGAVQRTDVLQLDARVIERVQENGQQIVSVRFWGLIREQSEAAAENFDEVWHLVRPLDESREWAIAGIQATV